MRPPPDPQFRPTDLARALERLDGLPIRPLTARAAMDAADAQTLPKFLESDPGWMLLGPAGCEVDILGRLAARRWWRAASPSGVEALERLWMHAVATAGAARRIARDAGRPDAERFARLGLIQSLGLWAVGAIDPDLLADFLAIPEPSARAEAERAAFGRDLSAIGRDLAERWGLEPLAVDSCWLHAQKTTDLNGLSRDPEGLLLLQKAHRWAERTPWALNPREPRDPGPTDPSHRILVAEVQVKCGPGLLDPESTVREEDLTSRLAGLRLALNASSVDLASRDRLLSAMACAPPAESPESWADRASRTWCEEPGISSARVVWRVDEPEPITLPARPPSRRLKLGNTSAEVHLWPDADGADARLDALVPAWTAWAESIAERERRGDRLDLVVSAHRGRVASDEAADRSRRLDALAEFAAGAGHELNNPLAVILGRAQLLIPRVDSEEDVRALRTIIGQAQRAHRILRDLMYVARPSAPRPRPCRPDEITRATVRDLMPEADARGIRLVAETRDADPAWADPDPIRNCLDALIRNALESTPSGGTIRVSSARSGDRLGWVVRDTGRGITADEGKHLFEPFYCGRQAGRGLGLGLPRAARFVAQAGGDLTWKSTPGVGSTFSVSLPVESST